MKYKGAELQIIKCNMLDMTKIAKAFKEAIDCMDGIRQKEPLFGYQRMVFDYIAENIKDPSSLELKIDISGVVI